MTSRILGHQRPEPRGWRLLSLLVTVLALALPSRRPVTPRPRPTPPLPESPWRDLALPIASPGYRDGLRPVPEPSRVRPYLIAEELRRQAAGKRAGIIWVEATRPAPDAPPELPRRTPGEHAPPPPDPDRPVPAASPAPPSAHTLQHVLEGLQGLQGRDIATAEPAENEDEDPPTIPLAVISS